MRCVRCVNENRKQRKRLLGCFNDWLFQSTIPIGWRLRAFEWKPVLRNVFCLRNFIAFIAFLAHFSYAIDCVACVAFVAFGWKPGITHAIFVIRRIHLYRPRTDLQVAAERIIVWCQSEYLCGERGSFTVAARISLQLDEFIPSRRAFH